MIVTIQFIGPEGANLHFKKNSLHASIATQDMSGQGELNFDAAAASESGFTNWMNARQMATEELARKLNLPVGHEVEVWLSGNIRLRGKLRLGEEMLFVNEENARHMVMVVDKVPFTLREMESCVRMD
jgi:hypothetical protein